MIEDIFNNEVEVADELDEVRPDMEAGIFIEDLKALAKHYINVFFKDKTDDNGLPFTSDKLHESRYISTVLNTDVCEGMDKIYSAIGVDYTDDQMRAYERTGQVPDDICHVLSLINACIKCGIPKAFSTGIIIVYLELCKGHKLAAA